MYNSVTMDLCGTANMLVDLPKVVCTESSLADKLGWPFLSSFLAVLISVAFYYALYKAGQRYMARKSKRETKARRQHAWESVIAEVAENSFRMGVLLDCVLTPQLKLLESGTFTLLPLSCYRLRTSAIDIAFSDGSIRLLGDRSIQVCLKNERERWVDFNLQMEHADRFLASNRALMGLSKELTIIYTRLNTVATRVNKVLGELFEELNSDKLRPPESIRLQLDELRQMWKEQEEILKKTE